MEPCRFCTVYQEPLSVPGGLLYEDELVYTYHFSRSEGLSYLGHLLLITKRHVPSLADLTIAEGQAIGRNMARLSQALKICTGAEKIYAEAYYEVVPHLHLHLIARYPGTPQEYWRWKVSDWLEAPCGGPSEIVTLSERLRASLAAVV